MKKVSHRYSKREYKIIQLRNNAQRVVVWGEREDWISELWRNVVDHILELLPIEDAAKINTFPKKKGGGGGDIWDMLLNVGLNNAVCYKLVVKSQFIWHISVSIVITKKIFKTKVKKSYENCTYQEKKQQQKITWFETNHIDVKCSIGFSNVSISSFFVFLVKSVHFL